MGRQRFKKLQVQDSAALVIQQNVWSYLEVRDWSWWKLFLKVSQGVSKTLNVWSIMCAVKRYYFFGFSGQAYAGYMAC